MQRSGSAMAWGWLTCLMVAVSLGGEARAEDVNPDALVVPNDLREDPALSRDFQASVHCPSTEIVAFTATGSEHVSQGGPLLLAYPSTITNVGGGWVNGGGTFIAPCSGLYVFTVSFVKDPYYDSGTTNDVYVSIMRNGASRGSAWAGQTTGAARVTGTYTVSLLLDAGDNVRTYVSSEAEQRRRLGRFTFTGYLVKASY